MRMRQARSGRRGFATTHALLLIMLVSVAVAAMGTWFATEMQRTRAAGVEGQERLLLLAGTKLVQTRLAEGTLSADERKPVTFQLPDTLQQARLTVRLEAGGDQRLIAHIECESGKSRMHESVTLSHQNGDWKVVETILGGS